MPHCLVHTVPVQGDNFLFTLAYQSVPEETQLIKTTAVPDCHNRS